MESSRPTTILLVEDNPGDARLIREMLREVSGPGFQVTEAGRLDEACERLAQGGIEVVLLDLSLPDAQGLGTVERIVACTPELPVVVLTGLDDEAVAMEAMHTGAQDYLVKGQVDGALLARAIRHARERKRLESGLHLLAEVGRVLSSDLDQEARLRRVATLAVPRLADLCIVDVAGEDGALRRLDVAAADPAFAAAAQELLHYPLDRDRPHLVWRALETGEAELMREVPPDHVEGIAQDPRHLKLLRRFGIRSHMVVPLRGRERTVGVVTFAATAFSGRRYGADELALARELAGRVALAVENARLYQRARKAVRARDAVLGMVAHDLRNPLTAITLGTSLALHHLGPRNGALRKHLQDIERSAGEMDRLIQDLLDVTRIEAGGLHLQLANEELGELLDAAAARFRLAAAERQIQIAIEPLEALPPVLVDQPRILQVFGNLMSNALRCTPEGGRIVIRATRREAEVLVSVSDTGIGIAPEDLPHVFDRFWQAGRSDLAGAGLGLAIVKGIVEAHGGRVCVESEVGVGTAFSFTLPLSGPAEIPGPLRPGGDVPSGIHGR